MPCHPVQHWKSGSNVDFFLCTLDTFPYNCIRLQINPTRDQQHGPHKRHTLHTTHPMIGCSASATGARATTAGGSRRSGWAVSKATCSSTTKQHYTPHTTHRIVRCSESARGARLPLRGGGAGEAMLTLIHSRLFLFFLSVCDHVIQ